MQSRSLSEGVFPQCQLQVTIQYDLGSVRIWTISTRPVAAEHRVTMTTPFNSQPFIRQLLYHLLPSQEGDTIQDVILRAMVYKGPIPSLYGVFSALESLIHKLNFITNDYV